jgi:6-pyruvoyltetrahydropterin/6-carboxytetrahydropterin synthase
MYEVKVISDFSGAHRLRNYKGKCEDLHGHNWKVEVSLGQGSLDETGMVIDFKELKIKLKEVLGLLDHKHLNDLPYFKEINPTSENIAKFIYDKLGLHSLKITVWETDSSAATYYEK